VLYADGTSATLDDKAFKTLTKEIKANKCPNDRKRLLLAILLTSLFGDNPANERAWLEANADLPLDAKCQRAIRECGLS
jgi:hypothetical protein